MVLDGGCARIAARAGSACTAGLGEREGEGGLDGGGCGVDVVAVERQARFKAQRIAGAEADGFAGLVSEELAGEVFGMAGGHRHLEAVFAGVAGAGDPEVAKGGFDFGHVHEAVGHGAGDGGEHRFGHGALQGDEGAVFQRLNLEARTAHVGDIGFGVGGVDHQQEAVAVVGDHQVIEDAALIVGE